MYDNSLGDLKDGKENKLFIPKKLLSGKKRHFSTGQELGFIFFGFVYGLATLFILIRIRELMGNVLGIAIWVVFTWLAQKFLRKFIINEKKEMARYMDFLEGQVTDLLPFWNIADIGETNDLKNAGRIIYTSGVEAYVIAIEREFALGRQKGFKAMHYTAVTDVITHLLQEGHSYVYYSCNIGTPNVEPLGDTATVLSKFPESPIYLTVSKIINYVRALVGDVPVEVEYYLVYTNGTTEAARKLKRDCEIAVDGFRGSLYGKARILNKEELIEFFLKYHGLEYLDEKNLYRKFGKDVTERVISDVRRNEVGDILRVDDDFNVYDGTEEYDNLIRSIYKARGYSDEDIEKEEKEKNKKK